MYYGAFTHTPPLGWDGLRWWLSVFQWRRSHIDLPAQPSPSYPILSCVWIHQYWHPGVCVCVCLSVCLSVTEHSGARVWTTPLRRLTGDRRSPSRRRKRGSNGVDDVTVGDVTTGTRVGARASASGGKRAAGIRREMEDRQRPTPGLPFSPLHRQAVTSYWCSVVNSGMDGTVQFSNQ